MKWKRKGNIIPTLFIIPRTTKWWVFFYRQRQLEEESARKQMELQQATERQKRDKEENKVRRIQLDESEHHLKGYLN